MRISPRLQSELKKVLLPKFFAKRTGIRALRALPSRPPLVSVVIPHLNEALAHTHQCLESIAFQSYPQIEIIVVDDGSRTENRARLEKLVSSYANARLLAHPTNQGLSAARNTGMKDARGAWITFLDSDDFLPIHSITERVARALSNTDPRLAGVYGTIALVSEERGYRTNTELGRYSPGLGIKTFLSTTGECPFSVHAPICQTSVVRAFNGFDESLRHGAEDWDLWYRVMRQGYVFHPSELCCGFYRQKRNSMVRTLSAQHVSQAERLIQAAYAPIDHAEAAHPLAPFFFERPLGDYLAAATLFRRQIYFAAISLLGGSENHAKQITGRVSRALLPYCKDIHPIEDIVTTAVARYHGVKAGRMSTQQLGISYQLSQRLEQTLSSKEADQ